MIEIILKGFSEEQIKGLAIQEGWAEQVMTIDLSPNVPIDNSETAIEYLNRTKLQPIRDAIARYSLTEARLLSETKIKQAQEELKASEEADKEYVDNIISVIVEPVV